MADLHPAPLDAPLPPLVAQVRAAVPAPERVWLVGGAVRDLFLNRPGHDLDFAVAGDGLATARGVADALGGAFYPLDADRGTGRVVLSRAAAGPITLDFAELRGPDIAADLAARDFTINALAVPLADPETVLDPLGGLADLRLKRLRACSPTAISDDPLRGVRAVRQAAQLGFRLTPELRAEIRAHAAALTRISPERQRDELIRALGGPNPGACLRVLEALGLLAHLLPELTPLKGVTQSPPHTLEVWEHTLTTVERLAEVLHVLGPVHDVDAASDLILGLATVRLGRFRRPLQTHLDALLAGDRPVRWTLMLAALLHDAAKPATRTVDADGRIRFFGHEARGAELTGAVLTRLRFSGDELKRAQAIVAHHMRPRQLSREGEPSARAIYRFFRATGPAGVEVILLSLADLLAKYGGHPPPQAEWAEHLAACAKLLEAYFEKHPAAVAPAPLVNGDDLIRVLGLKPGPEVGRLLEAIREAQAAGEVLDPEAALALARRLAAPKT